MDGNAAADAEVTKSIPVVKSEGSTRIVNLHHEVLDEFAPDDTVKIVTQPPAEASQGNGKHNRLGEPGETLDLEIGAFYKRTRCGLSTRSSHR